MSQVITENSLTENSLTKNELILVRFLLNQFDDVAMNKIKHRVTLDNDDNHSVVLDSAYQKIGDMLFTFLEK